MGFEDGQVADEHGLQVGFPILPDERRSDGARRGIVAGFEIHNLADESDQSL